MKLIVIVNNETDTFEACFPSRDLSAEEIITINEMMGHGGLYTVHLVECGDKPIPFIDIIEGLKKILHTNFDVDMDKIRSIPIKYIKK